jgi:ABC-2 type transport system ATP-binding protein
LSVARPFGSPGFSHRGRKCLQLDEHSMIEFDHVSRTYGDKLAVAELDLKIPAGELFALLGPNGAGKTTSIKMMVGLLHPSSGHVRICGRDMVRETREANRLVGFVPDEPYLYEKLSGREFLEFVADMHGLDRKDTAARVRREVQNFQLTSFLDDRTETYSHGMRQRLSFAAALLHDPAVLVVDEPMIGLDPRSVRMVKDLLRAKAAQGMIVFMSTHSLAVAEEIADRIGILDHGRMKFLGTLGELRRELAHDRTSLEELYLQLTSVDETIESA